ncbi:MAG TPA: ATP-binding cassette domain-containing protein, partial [Clostridia bacterium]|nr:ATP-binding cassette domain-containing protein [Clostridia bacterium]
ADRSIQDHLAVIQALEARLHALEPREGLSGGEQTRLRLARALGQHAPLLLLDEPTANLDWEGCEQLECLLAAHSGGFVLVSHDRALLDRVCQGILALENGALVRYAGNWSAYRQQRERQRERERFEYEQYRAEEKRLKQAIQGMREARDQVRKTPTRMGNSEARLHKRKSTGAQKQLDHLRSALESRLGQLETKERPREETEWNLSDANFSGLISETALRVKDLTLWAGKKLLLEKASMIVPARDCTAVLGPNGCGKTTLLRALVSQRPGIRWSPGLHIGYFSQDTLETLVETESVLENVMRDCARPQAQARTVLARLGLGAGSVEKQVRVLSGGERAKCLLVKLLLGPSNLLVLDEPGNHLDIYASEALDQLLKSYPGAIVLVSHDRRMVETVARRVVRFEDHRLKTFEGSLELEGTREDTKKVEESVLRMRMAELAGRIAMPSKGDDVEVLRAAWDREALRLRQLRGEG